MDPRQTSQRATPGIYPSSGAGATPLLEEVLRPRIRAEGPLSFESFMDLALYHEDHGYYSDPSRLRIGTAGDFATNVSVGETFGRLLSLRLHRLWQEGGQPATMHLFELGPEDGSLALDVLRGVQALSPQFHGALHYAACEPSPRKRAALAARFGDAGEPNLRAIGMPPGATAGFGAVLANEVLDALPVRLIRFVEGAWIERRVGLQDESLIWVDAPIVDPLLARQVAALGTNFPDGYQTELCSVLEPFFESLMPLVDRGHFLFIDYGFAHDDYYHPDRTGGTLQTYAHHEARQDPLDSPGIRDITAHVDFTAVATAAGRAGLIPHGFARQESYLTNLAAPLLRELTDDPPPDSFIRQFRTLTHPGFFGSRFHVLELRKGTLPSGASFPCRSAGLESLGLPPASP